MSYLCPQICTVFGIASSNKRHKHKHKTDNVDYYEAIGTTSRISYLSLSLFAVGNNCLSMHMQLATYETYIARGAPQIEHEHIRTICVLACCCRIYYIYNELPLLVPLSSLNRVSIASSSPPCYEEEERRDICDFAPYTMRQ